MKKDHISQRLENLCNHLIQVSMSFKRNLRGTHYDISDIDLMNLFNESSEYHIGVRAVHRRLVNTYYQSTQNRGGDGVYIEWGYTL